MRTVNRLRVRLRNLLSGQRGDHRLREEMEAHLAMQTEENIRTGMTPAEARRQARLKFGVVEAMREQYHAEEGLPLLENLVHDVRYALRQLRKSPGFTLTAVLTLALGIGALITVTIWTNAVLFDPWPQVRDVRSLRFIDASFMGGAGWSVHYDQMEFLRRHSHSFTELTAFASSELNLNSANESPQVIEGGIVSSNYFHLLGVRPELGRFFEPSSDARDYGAHDDVVLSDALWRSRFGGDRSEVGRIISINQHPFTVIGIAPKGFLGVFGGLAEAAWVPLSSLRDLSPDAPPDPLRHYGLQVAVRLRSGVRGGTAQAELHTLAREYEATQHQSYDGWTLNLRNCAHFERGLFYGISEELPLLAGASALLMVLVCLNIASLLGQHAARRRRETAIRAALGAAPRRIASQVLVETGILAGMGALAGWIAGLGLSRTLYLMLPGFGFPLAFNLRNDWRVDTVAAGIAVVVTLACGLAPLRQALRVSQQEALHEGGAAVAGAPRKRRGQRALLGLQMGICFIVLVCCGLLTRTALNIYSRNPGFNRRAMLTATLGLSRAGYSPGRAEVFLTELLERLRHAPGVAAVTITTHLPMGDNGSNNTRGFSVPGYVPSKGEDMDVVTDYDGPDFFHAMGIGVLEGRDFAVSDTPGSPKVAVINLAMVHRCWPKGNALGRNIVVDGIERQVVGVVPNFMYQSPDDTDPSPVVFLPYLQAPTGYGYAILALRSRTTADALTGELRQAVAALDRTLPLEDVRTLEQVTDGQYQGYRVPAELLGVYAIASVMVAMMGLYAVMAYSVIERHREFALRIALGSTRQSIFSLVLRGSSGVAISGVVTGGLGSVAAVRLLRSMLFGVGPFDPASYFAAAALLLLTVFVSGLVPARRAASVDPMQALRSE
ncbi:MAG TPA: ABC transporter permease [Acidobacteriaceae bacterium]|nr:ABC transporter permease [Acidobacteriaceae bacterium]